ncbi:MAG: glycoside hydrolase family 172 protein [Candidatus Sigynarchaeum springense]
MAADTFGSSSLRDIAKIKRFRRKRASSYDRTGGNIDFILIAPGERKVIFDTPGPGCITHIWTTQMAWNAPAWPRHVILRMWWDGEAEPSVECPLGDFFGLGHGQRLNFDSEPLQMSPDHGKGFNCWWPMPFKKHVRIEIENDNPTSKVLDPDHPLKLRPGIMLYYYIDYEIYDEWPAEPDSPLGYFHVQFRCNDYKDQRTDFTTGKRMNWLEWQVLKGKNTRENGGYDRNHVILEAKGTGHYVGCVINIDNPRRWWMPIMNWPGEGDDMIFIDDDVGGEPTLYGTGTEDYVNMAFCPQEKYSSAYHGVIKGGGWNWAGKITYYRFHVQDRITFQKQIKVTIEHGHNNHRGGRWETTAYWYQLEPHAASLNPPLPTREARMPRPYHETAARIGKKIASLVVKTSLYVLLVYATVLVLQVFGLI